MLNKIEEVNKLLNPNGDRKPLDVFIDFVINSNLGTILYKKVNDFLKKDKNLSETDKSIFYNNFIKNHSDEIIKIKNNVIEKLANMLKGVNEDAIKQILEFNIEQWFALPDFAFVLSDFIQECLTDEINKATRNWFSEK